MVGRAMDAASRASVAQAVSENGRRIRRLLRFRISLAVNVAARIHTGIIDTTWQREWMGKVARDIVDIKQLVGKITTAHLVSQQDQ